VTEPSTVPAGALLVDPGRRGRPVVSDRVRHPLLNARGVERVESRVEALSDLLGRAFADRPVDTRRPGSRLVDRPLEEPSGVGTVVAIRSNQ
jgi:hypothetical protein